MLTIGERRSARFVSGFSLPELVIAVAIIAVLISILLPTISHARRRANAVICASNLRQWGVAANLYATDNHGCLPRRGQGVAPTTLINRPSDWFNALPPLMNMPSFNELATANKIVRPSERSVWSCPDAIDTGAALFWSYGMNMALSTWLGGVPDNIGHVDKADAVVLFADGPGNHCSVIPSSMSYSPVARHAGSVNVCFLDGHVAAFASKYVGCGVGLPDPERVDLRWSLPGSTWSGP